MGIDLYSADLQDTRRCFALLDVFTDRFVWIVATNVGSLRLVSDEKDSVAEGRSAL